MQGRQRESRSLAGSYNRKRESAKSRESCWRLSYPASWRTCSSAGPFPLGARHRLAVSFNYWNAGNGVSGPRVVIIPARLQFSALLLREDVLEGVSWSVRVSSRSVCGRLRRDLRNALVVVLKSPVARTARRAALKDPRRQVIHLPPEHCKKKRFSSID